VSAVDVATSARADLVCDCAPASLAPMGALFVLNEIGASPLWLLDASATPKLVFVPSSLLNPTPQN
jgi:hypothetical protein